MAHPPMRDRLVAIANSNIGNPSGFLEDLSDPHEDWHREFTRTYGFLLFHHRVVRSFQAVVNPTLQTPVTPFSDGDFQTMGVQPFQANLGGIDALDELAAFSSAIESWHNTAHGGIASATGTPLMDPRQNIFFRAFWQLHLYIEEFFVQILDQYGDSAHPGQFVAPDLVASHIETAHHGWVPRI